MSTLYIRLASKAAADSAPLWPTLPCQFALVSNGNSIERQGTAPLSDLSDTIANAQRVVALLAASDVTLLRLKVPPLSAAKLKTALPNLVEDQLITDPSESVVVAGDLSDGLRTVAVVQRDWLDILAKTFIAFGARHITALPSQLCLPYVSGQSGQIVAVVANEWEAEHHSGIDMTLRLSEHDGIGLALMREQNQSAASVALQALDALVPEASITLYVPQSSVLAYQDAANNTVALGKRFNVSADSWARWIAGAGIATLDLMAGLGLRTGSRLDWHPWRWPLALAAVVLAVNISALNIEWWRMKSESNSLRAAMIQIYKSAYPKESVIIDPIAQMKQKIGIAKHESGQAAPDDFTAITAALGEAWASSVVGSGKATAIAAIEYRERSLYVRLKPGSEAPTQQMKAALAKHDLMLDLVPEQSGAVVWKIRSAK